MAVNGKSNFGVVAGQRNRLHLADFDPGDVDIVSWVDPAGVGEVGGVGPALRPERQ
jgi:hypothetical protein